ncbi:MAG: mannose-1-phosphate guanylyltransferase [Anaerolineales bacterium]|nr:mannose-1-phosphate guanylyltransferase [Anaerolineales bacterium]
MKIVIFAGGSGRRLWPISRQKSPKQFEPILGDKSTLQLAVDRVFTTYGADNIFLSTNELYKHIVREQLPAIDPTHVIGEPTRRDLAAAVGLAMAHLVATDPSAAEEPVAIIWGDSYLEEVPKFLHLLAIAEELLRDPNNDILFIGETPRFPNENLGWLALGDQLGQFDATPYYQYTSLTYRPALDVCQKMFAANSHVWNTGYFVTTPGFVQEMYALYQPTMWEKLSAIQTTIGKSDYPATLRAIYPTIESISFDDAVLTHVLPDRAIVLHGALGWSDPGSLYALKEAINPDPHSTVTLGNVIIENSQDSLVYNYQDDKLLVAIGLDGMIVVNTEDAVLVVHKDHIPLVKNVVNGLEGTNLESFS